MPLRPLCSLCCLLLLGCLGQTEATGELPNNTGAGGGQVAPGGSAGVGGGTAGEGGGIASGGAAGLAGQSGGPVAGTAGAAGQTVGAGGSGGGSCGLTVCGGDCVDTSSDPAHCGACFSPCSSACNNGECLKWNKIQVGVGFACLLASDKTAWCLGWENKHYQLGNGTNDPHFSPQKVPLENVEDISLGTDHGCILSTSGQTYCWGGNKFGQIGNGSFTDQVIPSLIPLPQAKKISCRSELSCAISEDGNIFCWGENGVFQLQNGTQTPSPSPLAIKWPSPSADIFAGFNSVCSTLNDQQKTICWGANDFGELDNELGFSDFKIRETQTKNIRSFSAGQYFSCATTDTETLCVGRNDLGQLGNGTTQSTKHFSSTLVKGSSKRLSTGTSHACVVVESGGVFCWGSNSNGKLGIGKSGLELPFSASPVQLSSLPKIQDLHCNGEGCCAITASNDIYCWGYQGLSGKPIITQVPQKIVW